MAKWVLGARPSLPPVQQALLTADPSPQHPEMVVFMQTKKVSGQLIKCLFTQCLKLEGFYPFMVQKDIYSRSSPNQGDVLFIMLQ